MRTTSQQLAAANKNGGRFVAEESALHLQIVNYLKLAYPKILFHTDPAGELMTDAMRIRQARLNIKGVKFPDLQLMEARQGYHGLFLEIKKETQRIYLQNGLFAGDHIKRQAETLQMLRDRGYKAEFAKGFQVAKKIIDQYLNPIK